MDDFLHNLRSGKLKQPDRGRRDYTDYKGPQRRVSNDRRRTDYYTKVTNENFALIKDTLDTLAGHQKRITDVLTDRRKTELRIADALEAIVIMMGRQWGYEDLISQRNDTNDAETGDGTGSIAPMDAVDSHPASDATDEDSDSESMPALLKTITSMRDAGDSWEKIARYFDDQNIPTVSGKGKWRGQGVKKIWEANS